MRRPLRPGRFFAALLALTLLLAPGCAHKAPSDDADPSQSTPGVHSDASLPSTDVTKTALTKIGTRYRSGGNSPETGFDCSGFVCWTYRQVGIELPRSAYEQVMFGHPVERGDLVPGDVVVFNRARGQGGYHSGIYLGNDQFVHSPSAGKTVSIDSMSSGYYATRFAGARRIPRDGSAPQMLAEFNAHRPEKPAPLRSGKGGAKKYGKKGAVAASKAKGTKADAKIKSVAKTGGAKSKAASPADAKGKSKSEKNADKSKSRKV